MIDGFNQALRRIPTWLVYLTGFGYAAWLVWLGVIGELSVEPIKELEHRLGKAALYLLVGGLTITPLRRFTKVNALRFRRAVGLTCFFFVCLHLLVWLVLDVQLLSRIWADIVKRPFITVGMIAFVLLIPLAVTSNNWSMRKLGKRWRHLHKLVYPVAVLGALHYIWLVKGFQIEPLIYMGLILFLLALRIKWPKRRLATR